MPDSPSTYHLTQIGYGLRVAATARLVLTAHSSLLSAPNRLRAPQRVLDQ